MRRHDRASRLRRRHRGGRLVLTPLKFWSGQRPRCSARLSSGFLSRSARRITGSKGPGGRCARRAGLPEALIEIAVCVNAAQAAFDLRQEVERSAKWEIEVLYAVFSLHNHQVSMPVNPHSPVLPENVNLAYAPTNPKEFNTIAVRMAEMLKPASLTGSGGQTADGSANGSVPSCDGRKSEFAPRRSIRRESRLRFADIDHGRDLDFDQLVSVCPGQIERMSGSAQPRSRSASIQIRARRVPGRSMTAEGSDEIGPSSNRRITFSGSVDPRRAIPCPLRMSRPAGNRPDSPSNSIEIACARSAAKRSRNRYSRRLRTVHSPPRTDNAPARRLRRQPAQPDRPCDRVVAACVGESQDHIQPKDRVELEDKRHLGQIDREESSVRPCVPGSGARGGAGHWSRNRPENRVGDAAIPGCPQENSSAPRIRRPSRDATIQVRRTNATTVILQERHVIGHRDRNLGSQGARISASAFQVTWKPRRTIAFSSSATNWSRSQSRTSARPAACRCGSDSDVLKIRRVPRHRPGHAPRPLRFPPP